MLVLLLLILFNSKIFVYEFVFRDASSSSSALGRLYNCKLSAKLTLGILLFEK